MRAGGGGPLDGLTGRERDIVAVRAEGQSLTVVARRRVSTNTVRARVSSSYHKLGVRCGMEAVALARQLGIGRGTASAPVAA